MSKCYYPAFQNLSPSIDVSEWVIKLLPLTLCANDCLLKGDKWSWSFYWLSSSHYVKLLFPVVTLYWRWKGERDGCWMVGTLCCCRLFFHLNSLEGFLASRTSYLIAVLKDKIIINIAWSNFLVLKGIFLPYHPHTNSGYSCTQL